MISQELIGEKKARLDKKEKEEADKRERKEKALQNKLAKVQAFQKQKLLIDLDIFNVSCSV